MTDWTARIDALLAAKPDEQVMQWHHYMESIEGWHRKCLALAAERMREPHGYNCRALWSLTAPDCTCGKVRDLLRILEGK